MKFSFIPSSETLCIWNRSRGMVLMIFYEPSHCKLLCGNPAQYAILAKSLTTNSRAGCQAMNSFPPLGVVENVAGHMWLSASIAKGQLGPVVLKADIPAFIILVSKGEGGF